MNSALYLYVHTCVHVPTHTCAPVHMMCGDSAFSLERQTQNVQVKGMLLLLPGKTNSTKKVCATIVVSGEPAHARKQGRTLCV